MAAELAVGENPRVSMVQLGVDPAAENFDVDAVLFPDLHLYNKKQVSITKHLQQQVEDGFESCRAAPQRAEADDDGSLAAPGDNAEEAGPPAWPALDDGIEDSDEDDTDGAAACFGYATIGGDSEEEEEAVGLEGAGAPQAGETGSAEGVNDSDSRDGFVPNVRPDMRYSEFEAEVVRAARYGAGLEEDGGGGLEGDWQEAEVVREEEDATPIERPPVGPDGGHAASTLAPLSNEKADAVKEAMKGFALPAEATPAWAEGISEEDWIKALAAGGAHMLAALSTPGKCLPSPGKSDRNGS